MATAKSEPVRQARSGRSRSGVRVPISFEEFYGPEEERLYKTSQG